MKSIIAVQIVFGLVSFTLQVEPSDNTLEFSVSDPSAQVAESSDDLKRPPELASVDGKNDTVQAEVGAGKEADFERLKTEEKPVNQAEKNRIPVNPSESSSPILNDDAPDWVREGLRQEAHSEEGDELRFNVETSNSTIEECREELDLVLLARVREFVQRNVLKSESSIEHLEGLTLTYIKEKLLVPELEFVNAVDRPAGSYQQLWRQIYISKSEVARIRSWEKNLLVRERTKEVGFMGGTALLGMTLLSGMVGLLAKREKAKLKE